MLFVTTRRLLRWLQTAVAAAFVRLFYHPPQDWAKHKPDDGVIIWDALSPLLAFHGFVACHRPEHKLLPPPPKVPPQNPFRPRSHEDLIGRILRSDPFMNTVVVHGTHIIGADRMGRELHIRAVRPDSRELRVLRHLTSPEIVDSKHNHTVPVISTFNARGWTIVVQPYWGVQWYEPPLPSRPRLLQVARELLEGISFMHSQGISHGVQYYSLPSLSWRLPLGLVQDIHSGNILISYEDRRARPRKDANFHVAFIDFESSTMFPKDVVDHIVIGDDLPTVPPAHIRAPEQEPNKESWDAFKSDVFNLGRCLQLSWLIEELEEIKPLVDLLNSMTNPEASERPTSEEALHMMEELLKEMPEADARLLSKEELELAKCLNV